MAMESGVDAGDSSESEDEVAETILGGGDQDGRLMNVDDTITAIERRFDSKLSKKRKKDLKQRLLGLDIGEYNVCLAKLITRNVDGDDEVSATNQEAFTQQVFLMFYEQQQERNRLLKKQNRLLRQKNKNDESSGELAQKEHRFNVRNHKMGIAAGITTFLVTHGVQALIWYFSLGEEDTCSC